MDQFEDQFLAETPEALGLNFEDEAKFFDPEAAQGEDFLQPAPVEESIYTDDPVRVYLREMGAVPLLTREGEVDLARRMERGKLRMQKAISRSAVVQRVVVDLADQLKRAAVEIESFVDLGDVEVRGSEDARDGVEHRARQDPAGHHLPDQSVHRERVVPRHDRHPDSAVTDGAAEPADGAVRDVAAAEDHHVRHVGHRC